MTPVLHNNVRTCSSLLVTAHTRWLDSHCWCWKYNLATISEKQRLAFIRHACMHDWTVAITLNVSLQPLLCSAPRCQTALLSGIALYCPIVEPLEVLHKLRRQGMVSEVYERIAARSAAGEVSWHINEVIRTCKILHVQCPKQNTDGALLRQVSQNHSCGIITFT